MQHPELEKLLAELREKRKQALHKITRQSVDAINLSEQVSMTHMSICDSNVAVQIKALKSKLNKDKKKEAEEDESED